MTNEVQENEKTNNNSNPQQMAQVVYYLYLASFITGITGIIGVIIAYMSKDDAPEWVQSHFQYQIRTFWISLVAGLVATILTFVLIGILVFVALMIWFLVRSVKGLLLVNKGEAHPEPETWMF